MLTNWLAPVIIDISDRTMKLPTSGQIIPVAVGSPLTPTPVGEFKVMRKVINPNGTANGVFGSCAIQLDADGGSIGIHGTLRQDSIGRAVSLGCIRVPRWAEAKLCKEVTTITPIIIQY